MLEETSNIIKEEIDLKRATQGHIQKTEIYFIQLQIINLKYDFVFSN